MAVSSRPSILSRERDMPHVRRYHHQAGPIHRDLVPTRLRPSFVDGARKLIEQAISRGTGRADGGVLPRRSSKSGRARLVRHGLPA